MPDLAVELPGGAGVRMIAKAVGKLYRSDDSSWLEVGIGALVWWANLEDGRQYFKFVQLHDEAELLDEELHMEFAVSYQTLRTTTGSHAFHTFELGEEVRAHRLPYKLAPCRLCTIAGHASANTIMQCTCRGRINGHSRSAADRMHVGGALDHACKASPLLPGSPAVCPNALSPRRSTVSASRAARRPPLLLAVSRCRRKRACRLHQWLPGLHRRQRQPLDPGAGVRDCWAVYSGGRRTRMVAASESHITRLPS